MSQWKLGQQLTQRRYQIEKILGEGGFGIAYRAIHLDLDIPIVIKTPNAKLQSDRNYADYVRRFRREAKLLAKLCQNPHPHIVRVIDLFEENNLPCLVMDFIPGESLYHLVGRKGKLSEKEAINYIQQIGSALDYCHQNNIIHRDAHPNNIIIRSDNNKAILIDFGIAGNITTTITNHSGNQVFAPWEQLIPSKIEGRKQPTIDIYTLAATFYYLVTNETPTPSMARIHGSEELKNPINHNPILSNQIIEAILKGMELEPKNRPQSVTEWLNYFTDNSDNFSEKYKYLYETSKFSNQNEKIGNFDFFFKNAHKKYKNKDLKGAIEDYNEALDLNSQSHICHNNLGIIYYKLEEYTKAIENYNQAINLNVKNHVYYNNRGNAYYKLEEYAKAIEDYSEAIKLNPYNADYYNNRGNVYYHLTEYQKAIEDYSEAIKLNPHNSDYYNNKFNAEIGLI
ncbi:MAG: hypothetical protein Tsb0014_03600 [Pleurocapsa sp.]